MEIKEGLFLLLVAVSLTCVLSQNCPAKEDIENCQCWKEDDGSFEVSCQGYHTGYTIEDYEKILQHGFSGKSNLRLKFSRFTKPTNMTSKIFDGFSVISLKFSDCNISRWADEDAGPAFVGLEDSLEELGVDESFLRPRRYKNYYQETAPLTLGHLPRLKKVSFHRNRIYNFGNDWFGKGANSLEILHLDMNYIYELGDRAFASLTNLKELKLNSNQILEISRSMFPNPAPYLKELNLGDNVLRALPEDMFDNMPSLQRIHLNGNTLNRMHERTWRPVWSQLEVVFFEHNLLTCNKHIDWMFKTRGPKHIFAECRSPSDLDGKDLSDLIEERKQQD